MPILSGNRAAGPQRWQRIAGGLLVLAALLVWVPGALAQPPPPPAAPVVTVTRSWYVEALIVAGMCGLALFVVCRSSRRN